MVIIRNTGGIGNQMFIYALYFHLQKQGYSCKIDMNSFVQKLNHEETRLADIFSNINFEEAVIGEINSVADNNLSLFSRIRRKFFWHKKTHVKNHNLTYIKLNLNSNSDFYLDGYWQSEKYFKENEASIRGVFSFPKFVSERNLNLQKRILSNNSISIHIRKGVDYQSSSFSNACGSKYYQDAIRLIKEKINNPMFYIFTDNIEWTLNNLNLSDCTYEHINWNSFIGTNCYLDMQLMSLCKHNIIANSTYSWWGAWLNQNENATKIGPKEWLNKKSRYNIDDIIPSNWLKI